MGWVAELYGDNPESNGNFGKIVGEKQWLSVTGMLDRVVNGGNGKIRFGGKRDKALKYVQPTIVEVTNRNIPEMDEETFGPILWVLPVDDMNEAIDFVNTKWKPLCLYAYT